MELCDICHQSPALVFIKTGNARPIARYCARCFTAQKGSRPQASADESPGPLTSPGDSSDSDDESLQRSSLRSRRPARSARARADAAVLVADPPPVINFGEQLARLKHQIQRGKKTLYEAAIKAEDLEAVIQGLRRTRERISKKRK